MALALIPATAEEIPPNKSAAEIAEATRPSLVAITHAGRPGQGEREGSGFFIGDNLVATNLHVIGEARPISIVTSEGRPLEVTSVHASDRKLDLAILQVKEKGLPELVLGDSSELPDGIPVVAMGNPQGFRFSVVEGVVSATRDVNGISMIQLAMPIEPGNSGGPLLDRQGRVIGIPALKSVQTDNIGFAVPVNALKLLLEKPNPIPIERWMTVGQLNPRKWRPLQGGARWTQRAGVISVSGVGEGFGGRALCLSQKALPKPAYEVALKVKLDNESGAAGLVFASDGKDRHYGFYPSNERVRLTYFDGPDVFSWNILAEVPTPSYQPGEWNHLRVRVDGRRIAGYVNGELVVDLEHDGLREGQVGLCKFRETEASFQGFSLGEDLIGGNRDDRIALNEAVDAWLKEPNPNAESVLQENARAGYHLLRERARTLERQAEALRTLSQGLHEEGVRQEMIGLLEDRDDAEIDLFHAALLIAKSANPDLDVDAYREEIDAMAEEIRQSLEDDADDQSKLDALNRYLFQELGFHGSRFDYYSRENSYINEVLEDREGLPITLSVLYMELAARIGVPRVVGIPLPGHFVAQYRPEAEEARFLIDVFENAATLSRDEANTIVKGALGRDLLEEDLEPASKRAILTRMLRNLIGIDESTARALPNLDLLLAITPEDGHARLQRAIHRYQFDRLRGALEDTDWILTNQPPGIHLNRIQGLKAQIEAQLQRRER